MKDYILVTGGAGYIGSHIVKLLSEQGENVLVFDNLSTGHREAVIGGTLIEGDLADKNAIDEVFKSHSIKAVIHFAGSIVVPESVENPLLYYRNNVINTVHLLEACQKYKVKKIIFSSTAAVYGIDGTGAYSENERTNPINPYGRSKLMIEEVLKDYAFSQPEFNFIALRYFNVAGADFSGKLGQRSKNSTHLIKLALEAATGKRKELSIFGTDYDTSDGTCIRDYIHVVDLAWAHYEALKYLLNNKKSHILNCGYGRGYSVKEVVKKVKEVTGVNFQVRETDRRAGDPGTLISVPKKIGEVLGWKPRHDDLEVIIKTAYEFEKNLKPQSR